jgi:hypothetical protein
MKDTKKIVSDSQKAVSSEAFLFFCFERRNDTGRSVVTQKIKNFSCRSPLASALAPFVTSSFFSVAFAA